LANLKSIDESSLITNCLLNKAWAQKELYDKYSADLYIVCKRYATDNDEAKDILQEGFIRIFTNLKQYRAEGSLIGWMKRVVVTTALNYIKKHKKEILKEIDDHQESYTTNDDIEASINYKEIINAFMQLPYQYRTLLSLFIIDGYTHKEIANILKIEESNCRSKLHRGRLLLQKILNNKNTALAVVK
jgi:RNA polymerase sigma factor (sigma-70 family)